MEGLRQKCGQKLSGQKGSELSEPTPLQPSYYYLEDNMAHVTKQLQKEVSTIQNGLDKRCFSEQSLAPTWGQC